MKAPVKADAPGTRDRLVESARLLFWERGYTATGVNDILARAEAKSGSFYHFFPSKEALLVAVLDRYLALLQSEVIDPSTRGIADPVDRVFGVLALYRQSVLQTQFA